MTQLTDEERARRLDKLKKCLALSKSPEPHEAAAAMRQAQKLMAQLGVTAEEAELPEVESTVVKTREGFGRCMFMTALSYMLKRAFGVRAILESNPGTADRLNVRYIGPAGRAKLAEYAHRVIVRAVDEAWAKHLTEFPEHKSQTGRRTAFRMGWLRAVEAQVEAFALPDKERDAIDRWVDLRYGSDIEKVTPKGKLDVATALMGAAAADGFTLHRPMAQEQLKIGRSG